MTTPGGIGTAVLDFGSTPSTEATVEVSGQTDITAECFAEAWVMARSTETNTESDHQQAAAFFRVVCGQPVAGVGFTITAYCLVGAVTGTFKVEWTWSD